MKSSMSSPSINSPVRASARGFTIIEILTVLAVIGILVGLGTIAYERVTSSARITGTLKLIPDLQAAVADALQKLGGTLPITNTNGAGPVPPFTGTPPASAAAFDNCARLDQVLISVPNALLEGFFTPPAGSQVFAATPAAVNDPRYINGTWVGGAAAPVHSWVGVSRLECVIITNVIPTGANDGTTNGSNFLLDGTTSLPLGSRVAYAIIKGVAGKEAYEIAKAKDKDALMNSAVNDSAVTGQTRGPVIYAAAIGGTTDVYIYLASF